MVKILRAAACIAVLVAAPVVTGTGVSVLVDTARAADNCAAAPGGTAPRGQHWYYRVDQINHRKCWYLHSIVPVVHAAADSHAAHSESPPAVATPPSPSDATPQPANAANAPGEVGSAQPAPHVTMLNVKPVTEPAAGTTIASDTALSEPTDEPPTANVSVHQEAMPARAAHAAKAQAAPGPARDADHDPSAPAHGAGAASAQTPSARLLLPLLALALGVAGLLIALLRKMTGSPGEPRLSEHPDDAWRRYETPDQQVDAAVMHPDNAPFLVPREPAHAVDLDAPGWPDRSPSAKADFPAASPYRKPRKPEHETRTQPDSELRLRILRQARQWVVPDGTER